MIRLTSYLLAAFVSCLLTTNALAWNHPGHMTPAAIAYQEVMRPRPELMEKIGLLFLAHPEASPKERAQALCWVVHTMGDLHQPMHTSDLFSAEFPAGNAATTFSGVPTSMSRSSKLCRRL